MVVVVLCRCVVTVAAECVLLCCQTSLHSAFRGLGLVVHIAARYVT